MTLAKRVAYLLAQRPRLRIARYPGEARRSPIHRPEGGLLPGLIVHRLGTNYEARI